MSEVKKCPKCGGEMDVGYLDGAYHWKSGTNYWKLRVDSRIFAYACKNCGYVELYLGKKGAES